MYLDWQENHSASDQAAADDRIVYLAQCDGDTDETLRNAIRDSIEKAVSLLHLTIRDDSLYLLFEWDKREACLDIVVTDAQKQQDSDRIVRCCMSATEDNCSDETAEKIQFWIRDYLTTCDGFFAYSLVAVFHSHSRNSSRTSSRNNVELL
jgi:hypothetical protein